MFRQTKWPSIIRQEAVYDEIFENISEEQRGAACAPLTDARGIEFLRSATLRAISVNANSDFGENDGSGEAMQAYLDRNARECVDTSSCTLFCLEHKGVSLYCFFTSAAKLDAWLAKDPLETRFISSITVLTLGSSELFQHFKGAPRSVIVIIDAMTPDERLLTHEELQALASS